MHGLINRSIQCFIRDTYSQSVWEEIAQRAGLDPEGFESMLLYEDTLTDATLDAACKTLEKPRDILLEDLGTYLVSNQNVEALRRLLRFGGATFVDFLHSLNELPDRARLAVPDLDFPQIEVSQQDEAAFQLTCIWHRKGFGHVLVGLLRAMADDYGVLAFLELLQADGIQEVVSIQLIDSRYAAGRDFQLAAGA